MYGNAYPDLQKEKGIQKWEGIAVKYEKMSGTVWEDYHLTKRERAAKFYKSSITFWAKVVSQPKNIQKSAATTQSLGIIQTLPQCYHGDTPWNCFVEIAFIIRQIHGIYKCWWRQVIMKLYKITRFTVLMRSGWVANVKFCMFAEGREITKIKQERTREEGGSNFGHFVIT